MRKLVIIMAVVLLAGNAFAAAERSNYCKITATRAGAWGTFIYTSAALPPGGNVAFVSIDREYHNQLLAQAIMAVNNKSTVRLYMENTSARSLYEIYAVSP